MNYYERHLGDYAKDTKHLSMLEHGAYNLLLDRYYSTEKGIPADKVYRVAAAKTKKERAAVDAVLEEFFILDGGVWKKNRCEEVIARYVAGEPEREEKKKNKETRQQRYRKERTRLFDELRVAGQAPDFNASMAQLKELHSSIFSSNGVAGGVTKASPDTSRGDTAETSPSSHVTSPGRTRDARETATQSPVTNHQSPITNHQSPIPNVISEVGASSSSSPSASVADDDDDFRARIEGHETDPARVLAAEMRKLGVRILVAEMEPDGWVKHGITLEVLRAGVERCRSGKKPEPMPIPVKYLDTVVRNMLVEQARKASPVPGTAFKSADQLEAEARAAGVDIWALESGGTR